MLNILMEKPQKIVVIGDAYVSADTMVEALNQSAIKIDEIIKIFWGENDKEIFASRQLNIETNGPEAEDFAEGLEGLVGDADILLTHFSPIPRSIIEKGKNLKAIITCRGGLEHICLDAANENNIPVINVIRNAVPVAEFTLGMIIALTRNIAISHYDLIRGNWIKTFPNTNFTKTLSQLTIGLVGVGNIGIEVATRLKALGMTIMVYDKYISIDRLRKNGLGDVKILSSMEELFEQADIVSLHLRLTEDTKEIIDKKYFSLMKKTAYFINTARGGLVKQNDLIETLRSNSIAGAAIDVFDSEPFDENSGFVGLDNVVVTPHIAGSTIDAIPKSPFMVVKEVDKILTKDITDRIVNYNSIEIE